MSQSSVIGPGTTVHGSVSGEGSLEIFGRVEGSVSMSGDVSLSGSAQVLGDISGTTISVHGSVQGDLHGTEAVLLERGARVVGDLSAPRIGVANGALVRGTVRTEGDTSPVAPKRAVTATAFKAPAFVAKPVAKVEPKLAPPPLAPAPVALSRAESAMPATASEPSVPVSAAPRPKEAERRPPPPVLPSLGKGVKATKKKGRDD